MADGTAPTAAPTGGKYKKGLITIFIVILILGAIFFGCKYSHDKEMKQIEDEIKTAADKYGSNAGQASKLITDAVNEQLYSWANRREAKKFADTMGVTYHQAVVDMAVGKLRSFGYLE